MSFKKEDKPNIENDDDFLDGIEELEKLTPVVRDSDKGEEFDFDAPEIDLDYIPSWVDEGQNSKSESDDFDATIDALDEGFTQSEGEAFLDGNVPPNGADLFGPASSDSMGELKALEEQRDAYLEALRQLQADFENYKKRVVRDSLEDAEIKSAKLMEDLLPVIDNFQLALKTIDGKDSESKKLKKGIELVFNELYQVLEKRGLEPIDAQGALFDPEFHDAVSHEDNGEHEEEIVVEVLRPGYKVRGRVVRPAMVKVAK